MNTQGFIYGGKLHKAGKINMGERNERGRGCRGYDYFVLNKSPELKEVVGIDKPNTIRIMFPNVSRDKIVSISPKLYKGGIKWCSSPDWETAYRLNPSTGEMEEIVCTLNECPFYRKGKAPCQPVGIIRVLVPDSPALGYYQIDTRSRRSMNNIIEQIQMMEMAFGKYWDIPVLLKIKKESTTKLTIKDGRVSKETFKVPVLYLEYPEPLSVMIEKYRIPNYGDVPLKASNNLSFVDEVEDSPRIEGDMSGMSFEEAVGADIESVSDNPATEANIEMPVTDAPAGLPVSEHQAPAKGESKPVKETETVIIQETTKSEDKKPLIPKDVVDKMRRKAQVEETIKQEAPSVISTDEQPAETTKQNSLGVEVFAQQSVEKDKPKEDVPDALVGLSPAQLFDYFKNVFGEKPKEMERALKKLKFSSDIGTWKKENYYALYKEIFDPEPESEVDYTLQEDELEIDALKKKTVNELRVIAYKGYGITGAKKLKKMDLINQIRLNAGLPPVKEELPVQEEPVTPQEEPVVTQEEPVVTQEEPVTTEQKTIPKPNISVQLIRNQMSHYTNDPRFKSLIRFIEPALDSIGDNPPPSLVEQIYMTWRNGVASIEQAGE